MFDDENAHLNKIRTPVPSLVESSAVEEVAADLKVIAWVKCDRNSTDHLRLAIWPLLRDALAKRLDPENSGPWNHYFTYTRTDFYFRPTEASTALINKIIETVKGSIK